MLRSTKTREPVANRLLAALPGKEYQRLRPHLEEVTLAFGEVLYESGEIIRRVYFPNHGIVSLLSMVEERSTLEVGVVGAEGMVGISVFLGAQASLNQALVQGAGAAMSMKADAMRKHVGHEGPLPDLLRRYTNSLLAQISQTAACNRFHSGGGAPRPLAAHDARPSPVKRIPAHPGVPLPHVGRAPRGRHQGSPRPPAKEPDQLRPRPDHDPRPSGLGSGVLRMLRDRQIGCLG